MTLVFGCQIHFNRTVSYLEKPNDHKENIKRYCLPGENANGHNMLDILNKRHPWHASVSSLVDTVIKRGLKETINEKKL